MKKFNSILVLKSVIYAFLIAIFMMTSDSSILWVLTACSIFILESIKLKEGNKYLKLLVKVLSNLFIFLVLIDVITLILGEL